MAADAIPRCMVCILAYQRRSYVCLCIQASERVRREVVREGDKGRQTGHEQN